LGVHIGNSGREEGVRTRRVHKGGSIQWDVKVYRQFGNENWTREGAAVAPNVERCSTPELLEPGQADVPPKVWRLSERRKTPLQGEWELQKRHLVGAFKGNLWAGNSQIEKKDDLVELNSETWVTKADDEILGPDVNMPKAEKSEISVIDRFKGAKESKNSAAPRSQKSDKSNVEGGGVTNQ